MKTQSKVQYYRTDSQSNLSIADCAQLWIAVNLGRFSFYPFWYVRLYFTMEKMEFLKILLFCLPFDFLGHQPPLLWMWASSGPQVSWDRLFLLVNHIFHPNPFKIRSNLFQFVPSVPIWSVSFQSILRRSLPAKRKEPPEREQERNPHLWLNIRGFSHMMVGNPFLPTVSWKRKPVLKYN